MEVRENALEKATTKLRHKDQRADLVQKRKGRRTISGGGSARQS